MDILILKIYLLLTRRSNLIECPGILSDRQLIIPTSEVFIRLAHSFCWLLPMMACFLVCFVIWGFSLIFKFHCQTSSRLQLRRHSSLLLPGIWDTIDLVYFKVKISADGFLDHAKSENLGQEPSEKSKWPQNVNRDFFLLFKKCLYKENMEAILVAVCLF